ncbi:ABC transporter ATP-binding protein [Sellimonas sp.]|uniref:ABC transporter ATP-binding protein n=1 Tax=Sellimonas sp. TaxID=2021466 RepID=UPI00257A77E6|nr:ABC transporter ATP-binding protein [Sellimonas sp.]
MRKKPEVMRKKDGLTSKLNRATVKEIFREIRWLTFYIIQYKTSIIFYIFVGVIGTLMGLAGSLASKYMIDAVTQYQFMKLMTAVCILAVAGLGNIGLHAVMSRMLAKISLRVYQEIYEDVYKKMMEAEWEKTIKFHSGDMLNRLNGDVSAVSKSILGWIPSLITKSVSFIGSLMIILYYDPIMAIFALCSAPVTLLLSRTFLGSMREYNKEMRSASSRVMEFSEESLQNLQYVKSFDLVRMFQNKLKQVQRIYMDTSMAYNEFSIKTSTLMAVLGLVVSFGCMGWGVYRLWTGFITYGTMTMFLQLSRTLSSDFSSLVRLIPSAVSAATSAGRIMEVTELPKEKGRVLEFDAKIDKEAQAGVEIVMENISFSYQCDKPVLVNCSMRAGQGEIVAITGPSGAGKTTLIRIIMGLISVQRGSAIVRMNSGRVEPLSVATRQLIAYVPQGNTVFSGTIEENLKMIAPRANEEKMVEALEAACAWDFVKSLPGGLKFHVGEKGKGLSEGQAQRIAIARALLKDAPVIIFDEATSALDESTGNQIMERIRDRYRQCTCIIVTHRLSALHICSRVYTLENGKMKEKNESC